MRRREFISLLGGATAAWPLVARAQQPKMPVVGYLISGTQEANVEVVSAFRRGLTEAGFVEGRNVAIEYRWSNNVSSRIPEMAAELVRRGVSVIAASTARAALAAKTATATIPIVFFAGGDAVQVGLVRNMARPEANVTGINSMVAEVGSKRLGLLRELLPQAMRCGLLVGPVPAFDAIVANTQGAAKTIGWQLDVLTANTGREIDTAFARGVEQRIEALTVAPFQLFSARRVQLATLAIRHGIPTIFFDRLFTDAGGLMSYTSNQMDQYRQVGIYTGRILNGEKPADLPVLQPTKFEFVINLQTARTLGIDVPPTLLALADEVIE